MSELINGKGPEEIKTALGLCSEICFGRSDCPYYDGVNEKCQTKLTFDALALIAHLEAERDAALAKVPKWIKPKEELPKGGKNDMEFCEIVNIVLKNGNVTSGWLNGYEGFAYVIRDDNDYISRVPIKDVEYWMPLQKHPRAKTEPPKEEDHGQADAEP